MIPYFISLLILGIPICWIEWTLGRQGGRYGFNSAPGIFSVVQRNTTSRIFGALAVFIPVIIYMYYVFIEAWCLGYAWSYLSGSIVPPSDPAAYPSYFSEHFNSYVGAEANGALITSPFASDHRPTLLLWLELFLDLPRYQLRDREVSVAWRCPL